MNLGEKIKKARLEAKMTQAQLAGDKITRNMLSQIENGKATPSVSTVNYISERLGLPGGYLLSESEDDAIYKKSLYIDLIKSVYRKENFDVCYSLCRENYSDTDDELLLMFSESALNLGIHNYRDGRLDIAYAYFSEAVKYAEKSCYDTSNTLFTAAIYFELIKDAGYSGNNSITPNKIISESSGFQVLLYHSITELIDSGKQPQAISIIDSGLLSDMLFSLHINAKLDIVKNDYRSALNQLTTILSEFDLTEIDSVMLFKIYSDLEVCCKELEEYQNAYVYSEQKNAILQKIKLPRRDGRSSSRRDK